MPGAPIGAGGMHGHGSGHPDMQGMFAEMMHASTAICTCVPIDEEHDMMHKTGSHHNMHNGYKAGQHSKRAADDQQQYHHHHH